MKYVFSIVLAGLVSAFAQAAPELGTREVLLENDEVEVVRLVYPVGTESGMHSHQYPHRVAYFVRGGKVELVPGDEGQESVITEVGDGTVLFVPGSTHNVRNIGDTEIIIIETELKPERNP